MQPISVTIGLLALLGGLKPAAGPTVALEAVIDFGRVARVSCVQMHLQIENHGETGWLLYAARSNCPCLQAPGEVFVPAGAVSALPLELGTTEAVGSAHRELLADSTSGPIRIQAHFRVMPDLFAEPARLALGITDPASPTPQTGVIEVRTLTRTEARILSVRTDAPLSLTVDRDAISRNAAGRVRVHAPDPAALERDSATVWIETTHPDEPVLRVPMWIPRVPGVASTVGNVTLRAEAPSQTPTGFVDLTLADGAAFESASDPAGQVQVRSVRPTDLGTRIELTASDQLPVGEFEGGLELHFRTSTGRASVRLPYWGRVEAHSVRQTLIVGE